MFMENLKLTLVQTELVWEDQEANRQNFTSKIEGIAADTDLILIPEMFPTGFSMNAENLAEPPEGPSLKWMQTQAKTKDAALSGSVIVRDNGKYYNRLYFVFPNGDYKTYDKRHLFTLADEEKTYSAGQDKLIIDYKGWKICPLICYDLRFPVWARNVEHYDLLTYVANWPQARISSWDTLLGARSIENICYVAGLNRIGSDANVDAYNGHSAVYAPLGEKISTTDWESEFVETITLNKPKLDDTRKNFQFLNDRDRFKII